MSNGRGIELGPYIFFKKIYKKGKPSCPGCPHILRSVNYEGCTRGLFLTIRNGSVKKCPIGKVIENKKVKKSK